MLSVPSQHRRSAFTIIELVVVMAIMAIVLSISVYQFRRGEVRQDIRSAADDIRAAWAEMQARALAGTPTPNGATVRQGMGVVSAAGWPTTGYGLMLYGTAVSNNAVYEAMISDDDGEPLPAELLELTGGVFLPPGLMPGDDVLGEPFALIGCAVTPPFRTFYRCFVPLPDYSPVLPQNTYIDKASIQVAPSSTVNGVYDFTHFVTASGGGFSFYPSFNFDTCHDGEWPIVTSPSARAQIAKYLFLAIQPPQPKFYINGRQGCQVVRFAVRSTTDGGSSAVWLQFDTRTGRVSTAEREEDLPNQP